MAQGTAIFKQYVPLTLTGDSLEAMEMFMAKVGLPVLSGYKSLHLTNIWCHLFVLVGSYFARDAKYSSKFCHTTGKHNTTLQRHGLTPPIFASDPPYKTMFLARVLVGEFTVGHPLYCRPPSKDASFINFYDSCVDDLANPKIFVIFDSNQIYPEYLVEFYWNLTNCPLIWLLEEKFITKKCSQRDLCSTICLKPVLQEEPWVI